jgi:hypothetical protein
MSGGGGSSLARLHAELLRLLELCEEQSKQLKRGPLRWPRGLPPGAPGRGQEADLDMEELRARVRFCHGASTLQSRLPALEAAFESSSSAETSLNGSVLRDYGERILKLRLQRDEIVALDVDEIGSKHQPVLRESKAAAPDSAPDAIISAAPSKVAEPQSPPRVGGSTKVGMKRSRPGALPVKEAAKKAGKEAVEAVAGDISDLASQLKISAAEVNRNLKAQTSMLETTEEMASLNVDRVKREAERLDKIMKKKRNAMIATWSAMAIVVLSFFATYLFVIVPFSQRRFLLGGGRRSSAPRAETAGGGVLETVMDAEYCDAAAAAAGSPLPDSCYDTSSQSFSSREDELEEVHEQGSMVRSREGRGPEKEYYKDDDRIDPGREMEVRAAVDIEADGRMAVDCAEEARIAEEAEIMAAAEREAQIAEEQSVRARETAENAARTIVAKEEARIAMKATEAEEEAMERHEQGEEAEGQDGGGPSATEEARGREMEVRAAPTLEEPPQVVPTPAAIEQDPPREEDPDSESVEILPPSVPSPPGIVTAPPALDVPKPAEEHTARVREAAEEEARIAMKATEEDEEEASFQRGTMEEHKIQGEEAEGQDDGSSADIEAEGRAAVDRAEEARMAEEAEIMAAAEREAQVAEEHSARVREAAEETARATVEGHGQGEEAEDQDGGLSAIEEARRRRREALARLSEL